MIYNSLGSSGLKISQIALGSWRHFDNNCSNQDFIRIVEVAVESGINFFDSAESYSSGEAEMLLGRALKSKRKQCVIASKFSHHHSTPILIRKSLEKTLKRLNTDYLDLYQQHWPTKLIDFSDSLHELENLKKEGKIRAIGVCNWSPANLENINYSKLDSIQNSYSALWEGNFRLMPKLAGISFLAYSPLAQGLLAKQDCNFSSADVRSKLVLDKSNPLIQRQINLLKNISEQNNTSLAATSLCYLIQKGVGSIILGVSSSRQLLDNLLCLKIKIDQQLMSEIDSNNQEIWSNYKEYPSLWNWSPDQSPMRSHS